jgi:hypothetical protein
VVAMAPAARPVLRKLRRVIELTLTSVWLKRVGEPDEWMLARTPPQSGRIYFFAMDRTFIDRLASESDHRRAKRIAPRECGWKHGDSGRLGGEKKACPKKKKKKEKNLLDSDRPSHGRPLNVLTLRPGL